MDGPVRAFVFKDGDEKLMVATDDFLLVFRCEHCNRWHLVAAGAWKPGDLCDAVESIGELASESAEEREELVAGGKALVKLAQERGGAS